jgi:hypothetical protein
MILRGLHLLLTYQCTFECDHCFAWGSPWQQGTMTLKTVQGILNQAKDVGTVTSIYFEGGEPFLYYAVLVKGVQQAAAMGFEVGMVSNGYWATSLEDALLWLKPFSGLVQDLSVSSDLFHYSEMISQQARDAAEAASQLGIPTGYISIAPPPEAPGEAGAGSTVGQLPEAESGVMYRGRAVEKLAGKAPKHPWDSFITCPYEDLREPGRIHVDPLGNLHICQGISIGNLFERPLLDICREYDPDAHPITAPLLAGGPVELVRRYNLPHEPVYADACHLCDRSRLLLRDRFPEVLRPEQMYGGVVG